MRKSRHCRHGGKRRSRHRRGGRQRVYSMIGCAAAARSKRGGGGGSCGACGCPIAPLSWSEMNNNAAQLGGGCGCGAGNILPTFGGGSSSQTGGGDTVDAGAPYAPCGVSNCNPIVGAGQYGGSSFYKAPTPIPGPFVGSPWGASIAKWPVVDGISGDRNYYAGIGKVIDNDPALQMRMDDSGYRTANSQVGGYRYAADEDAVAVAEEASASAASSASLPASLSAVAPSSTTRRRRRRRSRRSSSSSRRRSSTDSAPHRRRSSDRFSLRRGGGLLPQELVNMGRAAAFQVNSAYNTLAGVPAPVNPAPYQDQLVSRRPLVAELAAAAV